MKLNDYMAFRVHVFASMQANVDAGKTVFYPCVHRSTDAQAPYGAQHHCIPFTLRHTQTHVARLEIGRDRERERARLLRCAVSAVHVCAKRASLKRAITKSTVAFYVCVCPEQWCARTTHIDDSVASVYCFTNDKKERKNSVFGSRFGSRHPMIIISLTRLPLLPRSFAFSSLFYFVRAARSHRPMPTV